ncbi:hypothetical protein, partial [Candidatus Hodarchaeum mangrovi]
MINDNFNSLNSRYSGHETQKNVDKLIKVFIAYFYLYADEFPEYLILDPIYLSKDEKFKVLAELFNLKIKDTLFKEFYLDQPFWIDLVKYINSKKVHQSPYHLSAIFESLITQAKRKRTGVFFSPQIPVKLICQFSLFYYLANKLPNMKKELFSFIFEHNSTDLTNTDEKSSILQHLKSIKILDPSCGIGIFLYEMVLLIKSLIIELEKPGINYRIEPLQLWGTDIDEDSIKFAKLVLIKLYFCKNPQYYKILTNLNKLNLVTQNIFTSNFIFENNKIIDLKFDL